MMPTTGTAMQEGKDEILRMMDEESVSTELRERFASFADYWQHQISELCASGRAMERLCAAHGWKWHEHFHEYVMYHAEESRRFDGDYLSEVERRELAEEAENAMQEE